jgi:Spy/CpxP family protein refolding chaperone
MRNLSQVKLLVFVALVMAVPMAFAQDQAAPEQPANKDMPAMHQHAQWQMADRGQQGPGDARWGRGRAMEMHRQQGRPEFMLPRLVNNPEVRKRLGITDEQAAKIRSQASDFRKAEIRNRADLQVKHVELHELLSADKPDRGAIDTKLQEISAVRLAGEKAAIDYRLDMREALTPEQRDKLRQMRQEFHHGGPGHEGPHGSQGTQG